jgi:LacI family transcriptional regulator
VAGDGEAHGRLPRRRVTLRDVAREAGVSVTSASRSLHGARNGARAPSTATIARVQLTAARLGYSRDRMASGLRTRESRLLGVLVPRLSDLVLATIYDGIEEAAERAGYRTIVANTHDDPAEQRARTQLMFDHRVDGLIIGDAHADGTFVEEVSSRGVPFVLVNRRVGSHLAASCDDLSGGRLVAEHLFERGHTRVAVIAGEPYASTGRERTQGFLQQWQACGGSVPAEWVVHGPFHTRGGRVAMERVLAQPGPHPSAVFAVNDLAAVGAMGALRDAGLLVGEDVAVVGFNDVPLAAELPLPLSSVATPMLEMGQTAAELLLEVLTGGKPNSRLLRPELKIRASSSFTHREEWVGR